MRLIITGDVVPTEVTRPAFDAGDAHALMGDCLDILQAGDFTIGNLECALTDRDTPIRKCGPNLKGAPQHAALLRRCGFTHLGLSNNHVMDFGIAGMRDTIASIQQAGMVPFGYGENEEDSRKPVYLEKDGLKVGIIAVCEHEYSYALPDQMGATPFDPFDTMEVIADARQQCDFLAVMYHGGKEQCRVPSPRLRRACRAMVRAGADLVLTQHSHCIGSREHYRGGEIVYGQGNFNFVTHVDHPHWQSGLIADITVDKTGFQVEYHPVVITDTGIRLASGARRAALLNDFATLSEQIRDERTALKLWEDFCFDEKQRYYYNLVIDGFADPASDDGVRQVFPHYLDCEAHLDVWQTVFKTWHAKKETEIQPDS